MTNELLSDLKPRGPKCNCKISHDCEYCNMCHECGGNLT